MNLDDYSYNLPPDLIAQKPAPTRDSSRLMVLERDGGIRHQFFRDLPSLLREGDVVVVNDTRVFPARLIGRREHSGGEAEIFLLTPRGDGRWNALCRPAKRLRTGGRVVFGDGSLIAEIIEKGADGHVAVQFESDDDLDSAIERFGRTPLPPYISRDPIPSDRERYQTVYAENRGAVAAPTAGLHFTPQILEELEAKGILVARVTLHVGIGTFRPLNEAEAQGTALHEEYCVVPESTVKTLQECRKRGGRIVAVGTTTSRALETASQNSGLAPFTGRTDIFIKPPYRFRSVDILVTNFHLPRSSLLMMVSAFIGRERILAAYTEAVRQRYRFYSYGDAMILFGENS